MTTILHYFFSYLFEAIILWQYSSNLFVAKRKTGIRLTLLCSLYLIMFSTALFESAWLNAVLYLFINFIFLVTQYRIKWQSALFHSAILLALMSMCEMIAYEIISRFTPHFWQNDIFYSLIIFCIFSKILYFIITFAITCLFQKQQKQTQQYDKSVFLLMLFPLTSVFVMITLVLISDTYALSSALNCIVMLSAIFLLAANLLVFGINQYNQKKSQEFMEMQLLLQKESDSAEYYRMLSEQNENQSILIHDIKKHLQSIDLLNDQKEHTKISAYIQQLMLSSDLKEFSRLCDHEMLNAILSRYKRQCSNKHIAFHADIRSGTTEFIDDTDLTSLFCNLLDNALEAADNIPDSFIEICTTKKENSPFVVLTVINSCRKNPFSNQDSKLTTSKSDTHKHGFGLKSVRKTIKKYHGDIQMYYNDKSSTFHTVIMLKQ